MSDKNKGLYKKFKVERTDGKSAPGEKHHNCRYFVIDIDHDKNAPAALKAYANECAVERPELSKSLNEIWRELKVGKCPNLFPYER